MSQIIIPYKPRLAFVPYHQSNHRYALTVAHRRAGKTVARINKLVRKAIECPLLNPRFGYLAPFYVQAKDIAWLYLKYYCAPLLAHGGKVNESELSITLPHNNAIIKLYGAENADRMRGLYFDGIVADEAQGMKMSVLTQIIYPTLVDRQGWLDVSGTPKGWSNLLGELYKTAKADPDEWFLQVLRASETDILPEDELQKQKKLMPENEYEQEYECSFDAAITGAVYGKWMAEADKEGRLTDRVKWDTAYPVFTAWDLGYDDATAIWFYQVGPNEILYIDYYEHSGEDIGHYCGILKAKPYRYHVHYVPQDAGQKIMAAGGRSIVEQAWKDHGVKLMIVPETTHANRNAAGRLTLPRAFFAETDCAKGIEALRNYQYEYDEDLKIFRSKPRHDWSSHAASAFELSACMWSKKSVTQEQLDDNALVAKFHRVRSENKLDKKDPYRVKPLRKR